MLIAPMIPRSSSQMKVMGAKALDRRLVPKRWMPKRKMRKAYR